MYGYVRPIRPDELYHFGVLGMRWGVRRYQNYDGTWKNGKGKKQHRLQNRESENSGAKTRKVDPGKNQNSSTEKKKLSKEEEQALKDEKAATMRRIAIAACAITLAAVGGYVAYKKIGKDYVGASLKKGTTMQRITAGGHGDHLRDEFFASFKKKDNATYDALLPSHFQRYNKSVDKMKLSVKEKIKAPSNKLAEKIFNDAIKKDPDFKKKADNLINYRMWNRGKEYRNSTQYEKFNHALAGRDDTGAKEAFGKILKDKGFNALIDVNDQKFSGYGAAKPLIVLDKNAVNIDSVKNELITSDKIKKAQKTLKDKRTKAVIENTMTKKLSVAAGITGASLGLVEYDYQKNKKEKEKEEKKKRG